MKNIGKYHHKFRFDDVHLFLDSLFCGDMHAKRVYSLADATLGAMTSASLAVHTIGLGLSQAKGLLTKHSVKQVDRLMSNKGIDVWAAFEHWVAQVVGARMEIIVAMDWTEFDKDGHSTIVLSLVTSHGRATPLIWKTVRKDTLKNNRNTYEDTVLSRLREILPLDVHVTILADRGFGDHKLFEFLVNTLLFDYVIRFRGNTYVTAPSGEKRQAVDWVGKGGRAKTIRHAKITEQQYEVGTVVCVQAKDMKEAWCIAASSTEAKARTLINYYAKRWTIEPSFRDSKDLRFGMGMSSTRIGNTERRDRLLLINAFSIVLLTILGAASEELGYDRHLKANTVKRRTHSLFRQGCMLYDLIPNMPEERLQPLMNQFAVFVREHRSLSNLYCFV